MSELHQEITRAVPQIIHGVVGGAVSQIVSVVEDLDGILVLDKIDVSYDMLNNKLNRVETSILNESPLPRRVDA